MTYFMFMLSVCFILGGVAVASNPSPYYAVLGLMLSSIVGCGWLVSLGVSFVALVLFLVYLGGMLVVFVYSVSLAADPFPETWGDWRVVGYGVGLVLVLVVGMLIVELPDIQWFKVITVDSEGVCSVRLDFEGVAMFYFWGLGQFLAGGWGLLLTLFVVLEFVRGLSRGAIRAV